ncbi:MAG: MBL fold metallo-hydrolase, partial [Alphaproteobacteria bacterium]|nr:MBL fold metallo-hydrolase [Alphaproteobacteria bacterium]
RFNTCFLVDGGGAPSFLIDCGASSLIAMRRFGVDPNAIEAVFISHLHGDHFGGLPFLILDAQLVSRRERPLTIAGPPGLEARLRQAMEVLFPGSAKVERAFETRVVELPPDRPAEVAGINLTPFQVKHPCGAPPFALRFEVAGKVLTYSGDTEWVDGLAQAAAGADLFVAEAYLHAKKVKFHLDYGSLVENLATAAPKRTILTHMSEEMLAARDGVSFETAEDGLVVEF